jgi:hypothetical protein
MDVEGANMDIQPLRERRRRWLYASLIVLAAVVLALVALRLMR